MSWTRLSPGRWRDSSGRTVNSVKMPRSGKTFERKRTKGSKQPIGKDVSIQQSASPAQIVYGRARVGGLTSFAETNSDTKAYLSYESGTDSELLFTANTPGTSGNDIKITFVAGTYGETSVSVDTLTKTITVYLTSSGGVSSASALLVRNRVRANAAAMELVSCNTNGGSGSGTVNAMVQTPLAFGGGSCLYRYITLAPHEIDAVEKLYIDDNEVTFGGSPDPRWATGRYADRVFMAWQPGYSDMWVQPDLHAQLPTTWTENHRQRGCGGATVICTYNGNVFPAGLPELSFLVRGKPVYDPRTGLTVWSQNAALCAADYLVNFAGLGITYDDIDTTTLSASATTCDDDVALVGGGTEKRYTVNGLLDTSQGWDALIEDLCAAMAGKIVYQNGKWYIFAGRFHGSVMDLNESHVRGTMSVSTHVSLRDSFNAVRGTFIDPAKDYEETDFPAVTNPTYATQDGRTVYEDITLPLCTSGITAQRIAKIFLEQSRQGIEVTFPAAPVCLMLDAGDVVRLSIERYGWVNKYFEVTEATPKIDPDSGVLVQLALRETAPGVWTWSAEETAIDVAPNTTLPDPFTVGQVTGLTITSGTTDLYLAADGTVRSRMKISWTSPADLFVTQGGRIRVFISEDGVVWRIAAEVPGDSTFAYVTDVQDGRIYYVSVSCISVLNVESAGVQTTHLVLGKTVPPSQPENFTARFIETGVYLTWSQIPDLDLSHYRLYRDDTLIADQIKTTAFLDDNRIAGTYTFRLYAVDTSGNISGAAVMSSVSILAPAAVQSLTVTVINSTALIDWQAPAQTSLPIAKYRVYRNGVRLGEVSVTFLTYSETSAGTYTYSVSAVDTGGNEGPLLARSAQVSDPPETLVFANIALTPADSELSSMMVDETYENSIVGPVIKSDSWHEHFAKRGWTTIQDQIDEQNSPFIEPTGSWGQKFSSRGWTTIQDQIDAGYPIWCQPGSGQPGVYTEVIDLSALIDRARIDVAWTLETLSGSATVSCQIETSPDGVTWTSLEPGPSRYGANFRLVRITLTVVGTNDASLVRIRSPKLSIAVQKKTADGNVTTAADGTATVSIGSGWLTVDSIQLTPSAPARTAIPVFTYSTANPTGFSLLAYDVNGNPVAAQVAWVANGKAGA